MKKILIVNPFGIGDVLFTTPMIAALKAWRADLSISFIGNARTLPFLKNDPRLEEIFSYERDEFVAVYRRSPLAFLRQWSDFVSGLRQQGFDTAIDCSLGSPLGLALAWAGIPCRIGYDYKGRGRWLTHKVPFKGYEGRHVAQYYLDLLCHLDPAFAGASAGASFKTAIFCSQEDQAWASTFMQRHQLGAKAFVIVHPGGGASWGGSAGLKRWPAVNFAKLADKMIEKGACPIILMGDQREISLCDEVAGAMKHKPVMAAGQASITQAAALMCLARLVVANDGGPLHVAVAAGAETVSVFGPVDPDVYGPYPPQGHGIVQKGLPCQPCYRHFRMSDCNHQRCLKGLLVDDVFNKIKEMI
ncbi:MAG: glycosyltransferase family 9 protein [Candidatus Omnitrophica bacterium]|nr:glycosyltransferase family 9 protein [Candidatus Omnitrophota bacterium]